MEIAELNESLKKKDLRYTKAREAVYLGLKRSAVALSPRQLYAQLKKDKSVSLDLVSVYRNLEVFHALGLVHRMQNGRFSACKMDHPTCANPRHHHDAIHLVTSCSRCGRSQEMESAQVELCELAKQIKNVSLPMGEVHTVILQGTCTNCD